MSNEYIFGKSEMIQVTQAKSLSDFRLYVEFNTGEKGIFFVSKMKESWLKEQLSKKEIFDLAFPENSGIVFTDEVDIAVEYVYLKCKLLIECSDTQKKWDLSKLYEE